jgi:tetratricopeptide (TPR) repeat protein
VTGNGWTFAIDRAEAIIELPPKAKILNSAAYTGFQGDRGRDFTIQAGESNIVFKATRALAPREGLTVAVSWPKGLGYELSGDSVEVAKEVLARGREYYQATDYARAREALEQVVKLNPQDAEAHYLLGLTYASLNKPQPKEALGELRRAVELKPEVYSWRAIGSKLAELKRHKEAAEAFKKALEADANDAEARYQLGEAYLKSGEKTKAKEEQKILQGQNDELAQKLLAAIKKQEMPAGGGGGQRQLERQLDEDAMRIRIKRGEIPSAGAAPRRTPPPAQAATPRATPPPAQAATPKATSPPTPPAGVGWKIERRGEVRIK